MKRNGFTMIELSIVLIIIGFIIGGIFKGKDMINSAEQKKFYNTVVKGWEVAINQYQDKTGNLLADGATPVNNGGTNDANDGVFDNINLSTSTTVQAKLASVGLTVPITNTGNSGTYKIKGKFATGTVAFSLNEVVVNGTARNCIVLTGIPTDAAISIDTLIDSSADAGLGDFRRNLTGTTPADAATLEWPNAETTKLVDAVLVL